MNRHSERKIRWALLLLPLLLAVQACAGQALGPTLPGAAATPTLRRTTPSQTTTPSGTASPTAVLVGAVGDRVLSGGAALTVVSVSKTAQIDLFSAAAGNTYLDIEVVIENVSQAAPIPYNPYLFKVKDAEGNAYPVALAALKPSLVTGDLDKGEKVRGHIAFDVNASANTFFLSFEPNVYLKDYQVIRFDLSQKSARPVVLATLPPAAPSEKPGEPVKADWIALTVGKTASPAAIGVYKPGAGNVFLDIEVTVENPSASKSLPCNPLYFKVKDADGYEYTTALVALDPSLKSSDLAPGAKTSGHVAFEVRKGANGFTLIYAPVVLFGAYQDISVPLGK